MRKIESGSIRMSKPFGAAAPLFKPSVPLFSGGCTVLSIQPSTSVLSEKALAALKYAFLQNRKVGITGSKVESLKPPCDSDLEKAEAAYSIARELVEWSEKFLVDDEASQFRDSQQACLETQDDHKMSDKIPDVHCLDAKVDKEIFSFVPSCDPEIKDSELQDPEVKLENSGEFKEHEHRSNLSFFETKADSMCIKNEPQSSQMLELVPAKTGVDVPDFLKESREGFDFFNSDMEYNGINFLSYSCTEPMSSLDELTQHTVDIDIAFPVPPLPSVFPKLDPDRFDDLASPIESPHSPLLLSPFPSPNSPFSRFPDS